MPTPDNRIPEAELKQLFDEVQDRIKNKSLTQEKALKEVADELNMPFSTIAGRYYGYKKRLKNDKQETQPAKSTSKPKAKKASRAKKTSLNGSPVSEKELQAVMAFVLITGSAAPEELTRHLSIDFKRTGSIMRKLQNLRMVEKVTVEVPNAWKSGTTNVTRWQPTKMLVDIKEMLTR